MNSLPKYTSDIYRVVYVINDLLYKKDNYISYEDIYVAFHHRYHSNDKIEPKGNISLIDELQSRYQNNVKKAKLVIDKCLKSHNLSFEERMEGRKKYFKYPKELDFNPWDIINQDNKKIRLKALYDFIESSADLFPNSWLANFVLRMNETELSISTEKIIQYDGNNYLRNQEHVPLLYDAIKKKKVVSFDYRPYTKDAFTVILSPHFLKEYNQRWFVIGKAENRTEEASVFPLDRIVGDVIIVDTPYISSKIDYIEYFKDVVGVTVPTSNEEEIKIEVTDLRTLEYIRTKPIHPSQSIRDNIVTYRLKINYEFETKLFEMANYSIILSPSHLRDKIKERALAILKIQQ